MERFKQGKCYGMGTGNMIKGLKRKYTKEGDIIGKELDPKHKKQKEEKRTLNKKEEEAWKQAEAKIKAEEKESKKTWGDMKNEKR